jgi:hypothetical protein
LFSFK